ncbi:50S ribosomal protein L1 [Candidatus Woesearchaeota archaeon]|nr:MAG: 50S ribosomal protein L1 [Candidatus Woesearchaeota archaeon]
MNKKDIEKAIKELKENSPKRNFKQRVDLIIKLKNLDIKKPENQLEFFVLLHFNLGKRIKVCALVGPELKDEAIKTCDKTIIQDEFDKLDKKTIKKISRDYDVFIAQANIMPKVATTFGRVLGPKGKMPNPKAGCVIPPKATLTQLYDKLQKTVKISTKKSTVIQCSVGTEDTNDTELIDNILTIYNSVIHHLPNERNNIKEVLVKLTMSKPVKIPH